MLGLIAALALVLALMKVAANPDSYRWIWIFDESTSQDLDQHPNNGDADASDRRREIDFTVQFDNRKPLKPDEIRVPPTTPGDAQPTPSEKPPQSAPDAELVTPAADDIEIDAALLKPIKDNTFGIRSKEFDPFYAVLAHVRRIPHNILQRAAQKNVAFAVLMVDSEHFRGKPLTIDGEMRRLLPLQVAENSHGVETLYEAWLFTRDSGNNPYRIVCHEIPDGIPTGETLDKPARVRVTGYFFKRQGYAAQGGLHTTPVILAKRLRWFLPGPVQPKSEGLARYLVGLIVLVAVGLAVTQWRFHISDKRFHEQHLRRILEAPREAIDALDGVETTDIGETLRQLGQDADSTAASQSHNDPADEEQASVDATG